MTVGLSTDLNIFQNNAEINYKLKYPRTAIAFLFSFQRMKSLDYASSAKLK